MPLYNLKTNPPDGFFITKFDDDFNVEATYEMPNAFTCTCPAGVRPSCRHRQMVPIFETSKKTDTDWFLDFDTKSFHKLDGLDGEPAEHEPVLALQLEIPLPAAPAEPIQQPAELIPYSGCVGTNCDAAKVDGIVCADDCCDIEAGIRPAPAAPSGFRRRI